MGLRFETAVDEAYDAWHDPAVTPFTLDEREGAPAGR
jgi:hypothetical protein